ncbi:MAG: SPOR domain-containing protein [Candidatus Marinimicrobia bacterium]|nr:SPOR domain-containing protein [Candidatus Neomarinimicrobiota bacterium]
MTRRPNLNQIAGSILIIATVSGCSLWDSWFGRDEINVGEYVTLAVEDTAGVEGARWVFAQLPDSSKISGFLPSDTANQVSFKPDVPGEYNIILKLTKDNESEETKYNYEAVVVQDSTLLNAQIPKYLIDSGYNGDTTISDTPKVSSLTDSGDQRRYLEKIVTPNKAKAAISRKPTIKKQSAKKTIAKESRGNLIPRATKTFTIQVSSWPSLEEAQVASQELLDNYGIDSYIQRAFFKDKDEIYFRLRVGNFQEQAAAVAYAKQIQQQTNLPVWVDYVRKEM